MDDGDWPLLDELIHGCWSGYRVASKLIKGTQVLERTIAQKILSLAQYFTTVRRCEWVSMLDDD